MWAWEGKKEEKQPRYRLVRNIKQSRAELPLGRSASLSLCEYDKHDLVTDEGFVYRYTSPLPLRVSLADPPIPSFPPHIGISAPLVSQYLLAARWLVLFVSVPYYSEAHRMRPLRHAADSGAEDDTDSSGRGGKLVPETDSYPILIPAEPISIKPASATSRRLQHPSVFYGGTCFVWHSWCLFTRILIPAWVSNSASVSKYNR